MATSQGLSAMQEVIEVKCHMDEKFDRKETVGLLLQVLSLAEAIDPRYDATCAFQVLTEARNAFRTACCTPPRAIVCVYRFIAR